MRFTSGAPWWCWSGRGGPGEPGRPYPEYAIVFDPWRSLSGCHVEARLDAWWRAGNKTRHECRVGSLRAQCHILFPEPGAWTNCGADPPVRSRPPGRLVEGGNHLILRERRAGPGGPARTRGSAPPFLPASQLREKYVALG